ncbi:MAG: hypothetical protein ACYTHJ_00365 [Planctomycetota bacterium]|jgi:hypothetical protein
MKFNSLRSLARYAVMIGAGGTALGSGCTAQQISAVISGIETVASELERDNRDDSLDFGEWLSQEIDDL